MFESRSGIGKVQGEPGVFFFVPESKDALKDRW